MSLRSTSYRHFQQPALGPGWLFLLLLVLFLPQLFLNYHWLQDSMMQDLHTKLIGSRLMMANSSPYFFTWQQDDPVNLFNPNTNLPFGLNGVTATPFYLWMQKPLTQLNYCSAKTAWFFIQQIMLFVTLFLTVSVAGSRGRQYFAILLAMIFVCYSRNWALHLYAGQYYIFFALLFSLAAFLLLKKKKLGLMVFPLTVLIRPFFSLALLPFLLKDFRSNFKLLAVAALVGLGFFFISGTQQHFSDYSRAMQIYSSEITGWSDPTTAKVSPERLEDCVRTISGSNNFGTGCFLPVQHYLNLLNIKWSNPYLYAFALLLSIVIFLLMCGIKKINSHVANALMASFVILILSEIFTPAIRNSYSVVQYIGVIGILAGRVNIFAGWLLVLGLALNHDFPFRFSYQREIGEAIVLVSIFLTIRYTTLVDADLKKLTS